MSDIELLQQAKKALTKYVTIANQYFSHSFSAPTINFNLRGKAAGKAYLQTWEIRLNPILFKENYRQFLDEVIPHELAHLMVFQLYSQSPPYQRVRPHGKEWKMVMEEIFSIPAKTTHSFEVTSVQGRVFEYRCDCYSHHFTIRRHNKVQKNMARYHCRKCKQELVFSGTESD